MNMILKPSRMMNLNPNAAVMINVMLKNKMRDGTTKETCRMTEGGTVWTGATTDGMTVETGETIDEGTL
ncbi:MAG TPA: hypothetical protein IAC62_01980 [Candidatus Pelethocola excrementipullorum]|nr:hypothetical protein [Candidatus Pelethocola excrementipullorum]